MGSTMPDALTRNLERELVRLEAFASDLDEELEQVEAEISALRSEIARLRAKNTEEKSIGGDFDVPPALPEDGDW